MQFVRVWAVALGLLSFAGADSSNLNYEYIVIGSGAGGGPLAARLALAGHSTLLIEAGDDEGTNVNYTVPAYEAKVTEDPAISWAFYVRHYADDARQRLDYKLTYDLPDGSTYTGLNPPHGATIKGVLYPRTASLGGCTAHNALVTIYPDESDFQYIADLTNDTSWSPANMRNYWVKLEQNRYRPAGEAGHGYSGWLGVETADINIAYRDPQLLGMVLGGASALSTDPNAGLQTLLNGDANAPGTTRDQTQATYQIPIATKQGARNGAREFVLSVAGATNADGSKKYPLDVRLNCLVTKVTFSNNTTQGQPQATGVQFLDGTALYRADPRSTKNSNSGTPGSATATREVIISGGSYNSPQILKLSGIGPAAELRNLSIPVLVDLPGVGANLQDHYEVTVQAALASNFSTLNNCTLAFNPDGTQAPAANDPCYQKWLSAGPGGDRGPYASNGFASAMFLKSSAASAVDNNFGVLAFGGPVDFRGYFPGYSSNATQAHNHWSWALLKAHPRNTAGSVTLRSADPRDTPSIVFNYFDTGNGDSAKDVAQLVEAIGVARQAIKGQTVPYEEVLPGPQFGGDLAAYVRNTAWGHHCSSTCAIGKDGDSMAVLDSSFRVRGVKGLRVVDASVYPRIPGTFTAASTYLVAEKAADVILSQLQSST